LLGIDFCKTIHHDTYPAIDSAKANLNGKVVFITGASKGVGRATAVSFARAGVSGLILGARSSLSSLLPELESAAVTAGKPIPKILLLELDVEDHKSVENAAREVEKGFGKVNILINNAGYLSEFKSMGEGGEGDREDWWKSYEVNIRGTYWVTRAMMPLVLKGEEKTVVNLTSAGALSLMAGGSAYQSSKNALLRFTEFICVDYADKGVLAFAVHPGGVRTEMGLKMPVGMHELILKDTPELAADTLVNLTAKRREWLAGRYVSVQWDMEELYRREEEIVKGDKLKMRMVF
jgi:NAD(P)-dependent dehydrogenase (short-subunit alcohol dehydrogenase family)